MATVRDVRAVVVAHTFLSIDLRNKACSRGAVGSIGRQAVRPGVSQLERVVSGELLRYLQLERVIVRGVDVLEAPDRSITNIRPQGIQPVRRGRAGDAGPCRDRTGVGIRIVVKNYLVCAAGT